MKKWWNCGEGSRWWDVVPVGSTIISKNLPAGTVTFKHPRTEVRFKVDLFEDTVKRTRPELEQLT